MLTRRKAIKLCGGLVATLGPLNLFRNTAVAQMHKPTGEHMYNQILSDYLAAWNSRDVDNLMPLFSQDIVYEDVALGKVMTREDLAGFIETTFKNSPDIQFKLVSVCGSESCISWEWRMIRTGKSGELSDTPGMSMTEINNGKIVRNRDYWSTLPAPSRG